MKLTALTALFVILSNLVTVRPGDPSAPASGTPDISAEENALGADRESDKDEGERIMRSFISAYNSYRRGDVSNITSLYPAMCAEMEVSEKAKADSLRKQFADYREYATVESQIKESRVKSYDENRIVVRVIIEKITWNGALLPQAGKEAGKYELVDKDGRPFSGDKYELKTEKETEAYEVTGIKEMAEWKVCGFEKVS